MQRSRTFVPPQSSARDRPRTRPHGAPRGAIRHGSRAEPPRRATFEHLVEIGRQRYTQPPWPRRPSSPTRSRRSRPPSATGSGPASRRRPTRRREGWAAIAGGRHTLIHAPTGSGKTLAAFLWCLDRLATAAVRAARARDAGHRPRPVRLAAQGADLRHRAQPPRAADRDRAGRRPAGRAGAVDHGRQPDRRHAGRGPAPDRPPPAGHPDHDARIALPDADQRGARGPARRRARHRRRGPRDRRLEARRPPRAEPRAPRGACATHRGRPPPMQRIGLSATQRPLDTIARFLGGVGAGREVTIVDAGARKPLDLQVVVPVDDMAAIGEVLPPDEQPGGPATSPDLRTSIWPAIHPRDPRADPQPPQHDRLHQQPAAVRAARPAAQRAGRRGARPGPPRQHRPRAAGRDRGGAQGRPPPGAGRDVQPRARDRHGRGGPRHPGREPDERRARAPAGRPGRPPGRRAVEGRHLPEVPRRPARVRDRHPPDARGRDRDDDASRATRSTSSPSSSWR